MRFLPGFIRRNWPLKLAALGLAGFLWTVVRVDAPTRESFPGIPVRVALTDPAWATAGDAAPSSVELRLSGTTRDLIGVAMSRPAVIVPVGEVSGPDTVVVLRREWIRTDAYPSVAVEDIQPSSVRLRFERIEITTVPFEVSLEGELPEGLALVRPPRVEPPLARVSGPGSRIGELSSVPLAAVDLSSIEESGSVEVRVDSARTLGFEVSPRVVELRVDVDMEVEWVLPAVPVSLGMDGADPVSFDPSTLSLVIRGARTLVEALDSTGIRLLVALDALPDSAWSGELRVPLRVEGVPSLLRAVPETDSVTMRRGSPP